MNSSEVEEEEEAQDHHGTKKSYDCTFCRRGFTNAQALGGHMNIHRKDRAKNKPHLLHHSPNSSNNNHHEGEFMSLKFSSSSTHAYSYSAFDSQRTYDNMYFHPPPPPPPNDYQIRNHQQHEPPFQLDQFHGSMMTSHHQPMMNLKNQELQGANLSLQIRPTSDDEHVIRRRIHQQDSDEVDLELRLGHHDP